jgi:tRNA(fMet)-specific endonuclease VapC
MYLFDTDILTNIVKPRPSANVLARLQHIPQEQQFVSTITISEIVYCAMKSQRPDYHLNMLENVLLPAVNIIGFDAKAAYICGRLRAELEKLGTSLALADLEIAGIAIANDFILVTHNLRYFGRIERFKCESWI